ncbi:MAG: choice-of-anchor D domain-containing protein, partial [Bacteroidetes bacterium]|nr:choice-of-anchor D domain-containing protein [Bacteroidota bacterium]
WQFVSGHNDFSILRPDPGTVIQDYEIFTIRFAPQDSAWRSGVYRLVHGNPSCPDTSLITFNGLGQQTRVAASVATVDFGSICHGTEKDTTITLSNIGNTFAYLGVLEFVSGDRVFDSPDYSVYLEQDSSRDYRLRFSPLQPGSYEGTYRLVGGPCADTLFLTLKGTGLETELEFDPKGPVRFGPLFVFQEEIRNITISNPGTTPAHITDIEFSEQHAVLQFSVRPFLPLTLRPGEFTTIAVRFYPSQVGEYNTSVIVRWDAQCADTAAIDIEAICVANPEINAPEAADLGVQECPPALRDTVMIRNEGNGPLVFYSISVTGPDFAHFRVIQPEIGDTVNPASSYPMIVEFDRATEGRSHAIIRLTHNDRIASPTEIDITAERTIAEFSVEGDAGTAFFTRLFVPEERHFIIRNTSSQAVTITGIRVVQAASVFEAIPAAFLPQLLQPGGVTTFDIRFTPNARGPFTGVIEIESDPCSWVYELTLTGSGDTDGLSTDRADIDYMLDPCEYTPSCEEIILKNQSPEPVEVLGLNITQSGTTFAFDPPVTAVPFVLTSNEERTLRICASPALSGTDQGTLIITSNDPAYPVLNVALRASRDSSGISVSEHDIDFGRLADCMPGEARRITITNTGTLPETVELSFVNGGAAFSATMTDAQLINPGQSYSFDVEFTRPAYGVFDDVLLLTTERCGEEFPISLKAEAVEQQYAANPDPLLFPTLNVGAVSNRQITVENNGGFDAVIDRIEIQPTGVFSLTGTQPSAISTGQSADIGLRFAPAVEGDFTATVCIIFSSPCADTICVDVEGRAVKGTIEAHPPLLVFGDKAQCEITTLFDTLRNTGTGPITLISAVITGPQASAFTNMTPLTPPEVLQPGSERIFEIRYNPAQLAADGPVIAALSVQTDDAVLPQFDIPLEAGRITLRADAGGTVDFGPVQAGSPESRTVTIRNDGSTPLCYVDASFPPELSVMPLPPFCINPGEELEVTLTLTLPTAGMFTGTLTMEVTDPCTDSTVFALQARGEEGALTQPASVDLGTEAWCTPSVAQFSITSTYLEEVTLESMRLEGPDAAFFSIVLPAPTSLPLPIAPGTTLPVEVSLTAQEATRNYSATVVSSFTAFGSAIERRTTITARRILPSLALEWITFPATVIGQSGGTQSLSIVNSSEIPVSVQTLTLPGTHFILRNVTPPTPHVIPPSGSMTAEVEFLPQAVGNLVDSLILISDHPCAFRVTARLDGVGIPQPIVQAVLSIGSMQAMQDAIINIPILTDSDLGPADVSGWSGGISFNRSMLWPLEVVTEGSLSAGMQVDFTYDNANGEVTIIAENGTVASGMRPLAWLRCRVLIGNSLSTPVRMSDDFGFTGGYATVIDRIDGTFELVNYCMPDDRLLNIAGALSLRQNSPNPVSLSRDGTTSISYTLPDDSDITLDLYDVIGRHILRADQGARMKGKHTLLLDVTGLRQGSYMYVLHTQAGAVVKRMVVIP